MAKPKIKTKAKAKTKTKTKAKPTAKPKATAKPEATAKPKAKPPAGPILRSLRSTIYQVDDLARAKAFYRGALGREPYFDEPFYVGFDIDGQELGLDPDISKRAPGPGGAVGFWRVDDIAATWHHVLALGGRPIEEPHSVGGPIQVAIVADPSGNYVGLIQGA